MTRVLHLVPRDADLQTRYTIDALRNRLGSESSFATRTVNSTWDVLRLRRERDRFDLAHAWDARAARIASLAGFVRVITQAADAPLPPLRMPITRRAEMRARLGLADDHFVMLAPGESTRAVAHERAAWVGSILHVTDERYRVLLWGRGPRLAVAAELGHKLRQPGLVVAAEQTLKRPVEFEELILAADALLVTAVRRAPTLPIAMAMNAGVPVVSCARPELRDLLIDNETSSNVATCEARPLAQRILDLRADPARAAGIIRRARKRVAELTAPATFDAYYRRLYGLQVAAAS